MFKLSSFSFKKVASFFIKLKELATLFLYYLIYIAKYKFSFKDLVLLGVLSITFIHEFFPRKEEIDLFLFIEHERSLRFTIFMYGLYIKMIIMAYCLWKPRRINRDIPLIILISALIDFIHWFTFSGIGFWEIKLIATFFVYYIIKSRKWA